MDSEENTEKVKNKSWFSSVKKKMFGKKPSEPATEAYAIPLASAVLDENIPEDVHSTWSFGSGSDNDDNSKRPRNRKQRPKRSEASEPDRKRSIIDSLYSVGSSSIRSMTSQEGLESTAELGEIFKLVSKVPVVQKSEQPPPPPSRLLPPDPAEAAFNSRMDRMMKTIADQQSQDRSRRSSATADLSSLMDKDKSPSRDKSPYKEVSPPQNRDKSSAVTPPRSVLTPERAATAFAAATVSAPVTPVVAAARVEVEVEVEELNAKDTLSFFNRLDSLSSVQVQHSSSLPAEAPSEPAPSHNSVSSVKVERRSLSPVESRQELQFPSLKSAQRRGSGKQDVGERVIRGDAMGRYGSGASILRRESDADSLHVNRSSSMSVSFAPEVKSFECEDGEENGEDGEGVEGEAGTQGGLDLQQFDDLLKRFPYAGKVSESIHFHSYSTHDLLIILLMLHIILIHVCCSYWGCLCW
jgi:hypothetical protein